MQSGKYQNCHLVLKGSFWLFLVSVLILFSSVFGSLVLFQFFFLILVLQVLSVLQSSENQSLVIPITILHLLYNLKPVNILEASAWPTGPRRRGESTWRLSKPP